jgi:ankyrin repeat protein
MGLFDFFKKKASPEELIDAAKKGDVAMVYELPETGADVNAADKNGMTALKYASAKGHTETVNLLRENGA